MCCRSVDAYSQCMRHINCLMYVAHIVAALLYVFSGPDFKGIGMPCHVTHAYGDEEKNLIKNNITKM